MKFLLLAFLSVLSAQGQFTPTNKILAAHSPWQGTAYGRIGTNTPAFEQYAFDIMLTSANQVREAWHLKEAPRLDFKTAWFFAKATKTGVEGGVGTRTGRFNWSFSDNAFDAFQDTNYFPRSFLFHDEASARLTKVKSKITKVEAGTIAQDALHALGLNEETLALKSPPEVIQYTWEESDGKVYQLPIFDVSWHFKEKRWAAQKMELLPITMAVSGITKTVVEYHNVLYAGTNPPQAGQLPRTNFYQLLGIK